MTNTVLRRWFRAKDRRRERALPREYAFSVTALGIAVLVVVIAVMFTV